MDIEAFCAQQGRDINSPYLGECAAPLGHPLPLLDPPVAARRHEMMQVPASSPLSVTLLACSASSHLYQIISASGCLCVVKEDGVSLQPQLLVPRGPWAGACHSLFCLYLGGCRRSWGLSVRHFRPGLAGQLDSMACNTTARTG